jgi:CO/xanthine dehydrogenase Mo-binding subunit
MGSRGVREFVAVVAAKSEDAARKGVRRIRVQYRRLPAVFDPRDALGPDAPQIHETGNLQKVYFDREQFQLRRGDVEEQFRQSALVVESEYATSMIDTAASEPHVGVAKPDSTGRVTIWTSCQNIFVTARAVSEVIGIPMAKIRLIAPAVGGGFGGKSEATLEPIVGLLALRTRLPVRWALSVPEELADSTAKHPYFISVKTGVRRDGIFVARKMQFLLDCGAYCSSGMLVAAKSCYIGT